MLDSSKMSPGAATRRLAPLLDFFSSNVAGGLALVASALVALAWSNSAAGPGYDRLLTLPLGLNAGTGSFTLPLHDWINEALMAVFFLQVGLEIRREMVEGELASWRRVAAPGLAALGGMAVPALIYLALNYANPAALRGWAVPVATDIAFALAALSLLGGRVPVALKVFLTALAILDDLGAIVVIALFYAHALDWPALALAAVVTAGLWGLSRAGVRVLWPFLIGGAILWVAVQRSGIHATLAGVALAFVVPMQAAPGQANSPAHRLEHALGGWVAFVILPLFGLANAGLHFATVGVRTLVDPVFLGIALGLLVGKQVGVLGATWLACRLRLAHLPQGLTWPVLHGGSLLCGIGFTMSLFIGDLAFASAGREAEVKLAVFSASVLSAILGLLALRRAVRPALQA